MKAGENGYLHIHMKGAPRQVEFPLPVHSMGYIPESIDTGRKDNIYRDKIEFCIRLGSPIADHAEDEVEGKKYRTAYPHLLIKRPGILHSYRVRDKREAFYIIYPASLVPALEKAGLDLSRPFWKLECTGRLLALIDEVLAVLRSSNGEEGTMEQLDLLAFAILEELIFSRGKMVCGENFYRQKIYAIASYFRLHYLEHFSMDKLIASHGLSRRNFFRYWKKYFTSSPLQFLQEIKMEHGANLLLTTDLGVGEIAARLDFNTPSYFIRLFKRHKGLTPCQYRHNSVYRSIPDAKKE